MDKAVIEFIRNNLKNAAQFIIYEAEKREDIRHLMQEADNFSIYKRKMFISGGVNDLINKADAEENHLTAYSDALEKIINVLIFRLYSKEKYSDICKHASELVEKYSNPEEEIEVDTKVIAKILTGEK